MITMTDWVKVLKKLKCPLNRKEIRNKIVSSFLVPPYKLDGKFYVDGEAIWEYFTTEYLVCKREAEKRRLRSVFSVESWVEDMASKK